MNSLYVNNHIQEYRNFRGCNKGDACRRMVLKRDEYVYAIAVSNSMFKTDEKNMCAQEPFVNEPPEFSPAILA